MSDENSSVDTLADKLREQHGDVWTIEVNDVGDAKTKVYYTRPKKAQYDRFTSFVMDKSRMSDGVKQLARDVIVHPKGDALEALIERLPGILIKVGGDASNIGGGDASELGKKL